MIDSQADLIVEWVAIDRLSLNPSNPRINDDAVDHVAASIRRVGTAAITSRRPPKQASGRPQP